MKTINVDFSTRLGKVIAFFNDMPEYVFEFVIGHPPFAGHGCENDIHGRQTLVVFLKSCPRPPFELMAVHLVPILL